MLKIVFAAIVGNALEFYELTVYGFFAPVIAAHFFPKQDKFTGIANVFAIFFVGYLARPLGALLFGRMGDRFGRKPALMASIWLMALSTCGIGLIPDYDTIGGPILLLLNLRIFQGLSCGGEYAGSMIFLVEHAPKGQQGFYGSFGEQGITLGFLLAILTVWLINLSFSEAAVVSWAWRLPFLLGSLMGLLGWYMRRHVSETRVFMDACIVPTNSSAIYYRYKVHLHSIVLIVGVTLFGMAIGKIISLFIVTYMSNVLHYTYRQALTILVTSVILIVFLEPVVGKLGDRIGRRRLLIFGIIGCTFWSWPYFWLLQQNSLALVLVAQLVMVTLFTTCIAVHSVYAVTMVPAYVRFSMVSLGLALSDSIFGGMTPYVSTVLIEKTQSYLSLVVYIAVCALLSLFAIYRHWVREIKSAPE